MMTKNSLCLPLNSSFLHTEGEGGTQRHSALVFITLLRDRRMQGKTVSVSFASFGYSLKVAEGSFQS